MNWSKALAVIVAAIILGLVALTGQLAENVDPEDIVSIQHPYSGELTWYTTSGLKWQGFGKVTTYQKRSVYAFQTKMRFNDGAHGTLTGSIQYELPLDEHTLTAIRSKFPTQESVQEQLVKTVVDKAIYLSGPLMSSKESYGEKRNALIWYVQDQVEGGVYKTTQSEVRQKDPITGAEKEVTVVEIVQDTAGKPQRQEKPVLPDYGVKPFNFSITELEYDTKVEEQIAEQQKATMDVQTAMAEAKKAEQRTLTTIEQGKAKAEEEHWKQEAVKAQKVTEAEQEKAVAVTGANKDLEVNTLKALAAEQYRIEQIKRAEADSTYRRQVMEADGALQQKLEAWVKVNEQYAGAIKDHPGPWVPGIQFNGAGGSSGGSTTGALPLIDLLTVKTARDLQLDMKMVTAESPAQPLRK